jgi:hypothetical protein
MAQARPEIEAVTLRGLGNLEPVAEGSGKAILPNPDEDEGESGSQPNN